LRLLLDTHAFLWFVSGETDLSQAARAAIADEPSISFVSAASAWEITTKHRLGKLPEYAVIAANVEKTILDRGFDPLPVSVAHAQQAGALAGAHKDPFDRLLVAQALTEGLVIVSNDRELDAFGVSRLW
jgi:PIN domain nuclease of toxin-antitoxin system